MIDDTNVPSNGILEVKLDYISKDVATIKADIKEIKSDFVSRREFANALAELTSVQTDHEARLRTNTTFISDLKGKYAIIGIVVLALISIATSVAGSIIVSKIQNKPECPQSFTCTQK